ncbi:MAG: Crp/Fnr family transcriptional regulator [Geminicoccaceae bacterium]
MVDAGALQRVAPRLAGLEPEGLAILARESRIVTAPAGTVLFRPGDACTAYLVVIDGSVRVQLTTEGGHEIVLYRVETGESCILTTSCLLAARDYAAEGVAESEIKALAIPGATIERLLALSPAFRRMVFGDFGLRLQDLVTLVSEVAFRRMDARLAAWLLRQQDDRVTTTHREIAAELGTAREVVSRLLKELERHAVVELGRGWIGLVDRHRLQEMALQVP